MRGPRWGHRIHIPAIVVLVTIGWPGTAPARMQSIQEPFVFDEVLAGLREKDGDELQELLFTVQMHLDATELTADEIGKLTRALNRIAQADPHGVAGRKATIYPARIAAKALIERLERKQTKTRLRALPDDKRIEVILDDMEQGAQLSEEHRSELIRIGKKAVPSIVGRVPKLKRNKRLAISILGEIGDPRAVGFLAQVLGDRAHASTAERVQAAKALAGFEGEPVVRSLIEALGDETVQTVDKCGSQRDSEGYQPCLARYFPLQHVAADALAHVTGRNWGWLYQEDFKTWSAWLDATDRATFRPGDVKRTAEQRDALLEKLFQRYMSGRPNPQRSANSLDDTIAVKTIAGDLRGYGIEIISSIVRQYQSQISGAPVWKERLAPWTTRLLRALDMPGAAAAADVIDGTSSGRDQ